MCFVVLSSKRRGDFLTDFSDIRLQVIRPNQPGEWQNLIWELERLGPLLFDGNWFESKVEEGIDKIDLQYRPFESDYGSVRGLIRFVRNRWRHTDKFQETKDCALRNPSAIT